MIRDVLSKLLNSSDKTVRAIFLALLCVFSVSFTSFAADQRDYSALVDEFNQALKDRDQAVILKDWKLIHEDPKVQAYLEANYPWSFSAYRLLSMSLNLSKGLEEYRADYKKEETAPASDVEAAVENILTLPSRHTNREEAFSKANQNQPTIQETHLRALRIPFLNNRSFVLNSPNQNSLTNKDSVSNQAFLESRLKAMFPDR